MKKMTEYRALGNKKKEEDIQDTLRAITEAMGKRKPVQWEISNLDLTVF